MSISSIPVSESLSRRALSPLFTADSIIRRATHLTGTLLDKDEILHPLFVDLLRRTQTSHLLSYTLAGAAERLPLICASAG